MNRNKLLFTTGRSALETRSPQTLAQSREIRSWPWSMRDDDAEFARHLSPSLLPTNPLTSKFSSSSSSVQVIHSRLGNRMPSSSSQVHILTTEAFWHTRRHSMLWFLLRRASKETTNVKYNVCEWNKHLLVDCWPLIYIGKGAVSIQSDVSRNLLVCYVSKCLAMCNFWWVLCV